VLPKTDNTGQARDPGVTNVCEELDKKVKAQLIKVTVSCTNINIKW